MNNKVFLSYLFIFINFSAITAETWFDIPDAIYFYDRGKPYFEFTNFAEYPFFSEGKKWPTSEHYYQAHKFSPYQEFQGENIWDYILSLPKASDVFRYVNPRQGHSPKVREDWHKVSIPIMLNAVSEKFNQNEKLRKLLLDTKDSILVEDTGRAEFIQQGQKVDDFYGAGSNGKGRNLLGQILMRIRNELAGKIDPNEDFICYANPDDYFNKKNGEVCVKGSVGPKKIVQKKPKKLVKPTRSPLELILSDLHSKLTQLRNDLINKTLHSESIERQKEKPTKEFEEEISPYYERMIEMFW
jgi:N-glycosidase YbiA